MAKYRQLYTEFWSDSFVLELTSEEKFFYLYLLTNTKTTQCGIYELSKKFIETEIGLSSETVEKLINSFCKYNKILYCEETKEIMILNWMKYNVPKSINGIKCVQYEFKKVKQIEFLKILFNKYQTAELDVDKIFENFIIEELYDDPSRNDSASVDYNLEKVDKLSADYSIENNSNIICMKIENSEIQTNNNSVKTKEIQEPSSCLVYKPFARGLQGGYKPLVSNRSKKKEVINKKQELISKEEEVIKQESSFSTDEVSINNIIKIFEENIQAITPLVYEKILDFSTHVSSKVIIMAIQEAVNYNVKTIKYITKILNSWISKGIKTAEQVIEYQGQWVSKKNNDRVYNGKSGGFCDYEQRNYDFDALEKQLLGIA